MIGKHIHHYEIVEKLGSGGMSTVYKALDTKLDRFVALKFLSTRLNQTEEGKKRFVREAKTASALDHPNICAIYEIGETEDGQLYIAMPCYEGRSLKGKLEEGAIPIEEAVHIVIQIARGLSKAHAKKIVHRDIKPANILISEGNRVKIVDFGLAKLTGGTLITKENTTLGTVAYMSPEQTMGLEVDHKSDIWALGVVLYELLSGERPFKGEYEQSVIYSILNENPEPLQSLRRDVPEELVKIVDTALQKDTRQRYSSIQKMLADLEIFQRSKISTNAQFDLRIFLYRLRRPQIAISATAFVLLIAAGITWFMNRQGDIRWAREEALPQIEQLVDVSWRDYTDAYILAEEVERYIPDDPKLKELIEQSSVRLNITTDPEGALIYIKEYENPDSNWNFLGESPIENIRLPIGIFRWKIEKKGFDTVFAAAPSWAVSLEDGGIVPNDFGRVLNETGTVPEGMVRVKGAQTGLGAIGDFFIDRYEVTNRQYKAFVDAAGYKKREYWEHKFEKNGQILTREEAMSEFTDRTDRPGPATWQAGTYAEGQEHYPVTGISWYEAAAYAVFAGRNLPTSQHWGLARGEMTQLIQWPQLGGYAVLAPYSNFRGEGPLPVGSLPGITSYGAYDMAGNVREWCWNKAPKGRLMRGGAWNSNTYAFAYLREFPAFDRSEQNGFRTVFYPDPKSIPEAAFAEVSPPSTVDFYEEEPVSDEIFKIYREQFAYDSTSLNSRIELKDTTAEFWDHEKISYDAAYGGERMIAHLFLPKNEAPPYQTVVYFPGSASLFQSSSDNITQYYEFPVFLSFLVKNGRAVLYPVYKGTFERRADRYVPLSFGNNTHAYTEYTVQLVKDLKRSLDYLETREIVDHGKIAYYGMSWGGVLGTIIPVVEERIKTNILLSGALFPHGRPEAKQINYITRMNTSTLMLNGKYDSNAPFETHIKPLFDLLGTPDSHKKLVVYETDHIPPKVEYMKEILAWLDKYLGPLE